MTIPVVDTVTAERETVQFKLEGMHHSRRRVGGGGVKDGFDCQQTTQYYR